MPGPKRTPLLERFWSRVEKTENCWLYGGKTFGNKYGTITTGGHNGKNLTAHRLSYELHHGPVPRGKFVCHKCDVKNCVNPAHLYAGDHEDNTRDIVERQRFGKKNRPKTEPTIPTGSRPHNRALHLDSRKLIVSQYSSGQWSQMQLAAAWRVSQATISAIIRGVRNMGAGGDGKKRSGNYRRKFSPEQVAAILADYHSGMTQQQVAEKHGCDQTYVSLLSKRAA